MLREVFDEKNIQFGDLGDGHQLGGSQSGFPQMGSFTADAR